MFINKMPKIKCRVIGKRLEPSNYKVKWSVMWPLLDLQSIFLGCGNISDLQSWGRVSASGPGSHVFLAERCLFQCLQVLVVFPLPPFSLPSRPAALARSLSNVQALSEASHFQPTLCFGFSSLSPTTIFFSLFSCLMYAHNFVLPVSRVTLRAHSRNVL